MSKITNLIGTTWRLPIKLGDTISDYGSFDIISQIVIDQDADGSSYHIVYDTTELCLGYFPNGQVLEPNAGGFSAYATSSMYVDGSLVETTTQYFYITEIAVIGAETCNITITGGEDISNPLFIDFINTYGTLVSGGEPPTAEGVKSKLQSLITASNAKTGKSDANLTDAVKTLLEGYKQGITPSGSLDITENGTFDVTDKASVNVNVADNPLPIEVATEAEMTALLSTAEVGAIYKYTGETTDTYENGALYVVEESE